MANLPLVGYVTSSINESKKVIWPSRETVIRHTIMVVVSVAVGVLVFAGVDYGLQKLVVLAIQQ